MIKKLHYCWFGPNDKPEKVLKCIDSWKKYMPDWEIIEWNESNYDVNSSPFIKFHYEHKRYAKVSDYVRIQMVNKYGGLYLDTDVELLTDISSFCETPFFALESEKTPPEGSIGTGLGFYCEPNNDILKEYLKSMEDNVFGFPNILIRDIFLKYNNNEPFNNKEIQYCKGFKIYPWKYFCPMDWMTRQINIQNETVTIHHYFSLW